MPNGFSGDYLSFLFLFAIVKPNATTSITEAIVRDDYWMAVLFALVFVGFFLLQFYLSKIFPLTGNKKWSQKIWMNSNMWFLHTVLPFETIYQLSNFLTPQFTLIMYSVVLLSSAIMFYMFVIDDLVKCWKIWRNQSLWIPAAGNSEFRHQNTES